MRATRERAWPIGLLALAAFTLMGAAWAIALPVNGTYDENQHIVRAYAVVDGQWLPSGRARDAAGLPAEAFDAPRSLLPEHADCTWLPKPPKPASCQGEVTDRSRTAMPSQAARYSPVYYALVGLPLRLSPDLTGVIWARLLSALLSAGLLASAVALAARLGNRLLLAGVALVSTPMVMNLAGSVNPNGLEITAGVLLFVALLALLRPDGVPAAPGRAAPVLGAPVLGAPARTNSGRAPLAAAAVASALLLTLRQMGPVLFAGVVVACLLVARRERIVGLARLRPAWLALGVPVLAGAGFAVFWNLYSRVNDIVPVPGRGYPYSLGEILLRLPGARFRFYLDQVVGRFSYGETTASPLLIAGWYALFAALVLPALWFAGTRLRLAVAGVFAVCLGILVAGEVHFVPTFGWYSHSRYVAPLGVGVVLLAGTADRFAGFMRLRGWLGLPVTLLVAATVPLDMYALLRVVTRFQSGIAGGLDPFGGSWRSPLGAVPALLAELLGAVLLAAVVAVAAGRWRFAAWQTEGPMDGRSIVDDHDVAHGQKDLNGQNAVNDEMAGARRDELG